MGWKCRIVRILLKEAQMKLDADPTEFHLHYTGWCEARINKMARIVGREFFKDKRVLEVGAGHGFIGKTLREQLGAHVTFTDVRDGHRARILHNNPGAPYFSMNQEYDWSFPERFDLIVHFGVSYHLVNWRHDLRCATEAADVMFYETEVCDAFDPKFQRRYEELQLHDQAANEYGLGTRVSAAYIEDELKRNGMIFKRFDDADLNTNYHRYDWPLTGSAEKIAPEDYTRESEAGQRRFWLAWHPGKLPDSIWR